MKKEKINKVKVLTGGVGCGKTFTAINKMAEMPFCYIAPCRQLAYEVFIDYSRQGDHLCTGECTIDGLADGNFFGVFESLSIDKLSKYKTLIIDEAHFITDEERGFHLINLTNNFQGNILLVTATRNFLLQKNWAEVKLQPFTSAPKKIRVSENKFWDNLNKGMSSIIFVMYASDADITSAALPYERLELQLKFRKGEIRRIYATNVLAQGINMPAENVLIEYNPYDSPEIIRQKIGRIGRPGWSTTDKVYYALSEKIPKIWKKEIGDYNNPTTYVSSWGSSPVINLTGKEFPSHQVLTWEKLEEFHNLSNIYEIRDKYKIIRYSKPFLKWLRNELLNSDTDEYESESELNFIDTSIEYINEALALINEQENLVRELILKEINEKRK